MTSIDYFIGFYSAVTVVVAIHAMFFLKKISRSHSNTYHLSEKYSLYTTEDLLQKLGVLVCTPKALPPIVLKQAFSKSESEF